MTIRYLVVFLADIWQNIIILTKRGDAMKLRERIAIKLCQTLPDQFLPDAFKNYCVSAAVRELDEKKHDMIRKNWERSKLECQLQKLKRTK